MCGITGIIKKNNTEVSEKEIRAINNKIIHRGPDDEGYYFNKKFAFGHRRLSILDLSELGHQPMSYLNKYWITYNGEIYNYLELKGELESEGYTFNSETDTEVIMAAYDYWGYDCLNKFNGMWAFSIFDSTKNILFFARDRFGIKPLYYKENEQEFIFGSEIKQLLNTDSPNLVNEDVLLESMLTHIDNHTQETYFKGVSSFPSAHYMIYDLDSNTRKTFKYYELKVNESFLDKSENELIEIFKELFHDSINLRLRSDVSVGTCLSGGLDSSSISSIASSAYHEVSNESFIAINAKSIDKSNDESEYARIVAKKASLDLNVVMPEYEDFVKTIDELVYTQEEPFGSPSMFMGWHVFQKAKQLECPVMLNGQGGDEILLGYERYFSSTLSFSNPIDFIKQLRNQYKNSRLSLINTIAYFFYFRNSTIRSLRLKRNSLLRRQFIKKKYFRFIKESSRAFNNSTDLQILEISTLQLPHLLRYEDRNSMRHSIETRLPFLDYRLVELAISLPLKAKIKDGWTKYILRKSVENILSPEVVWRKNKFGFEAPEKIWLTKYNDQMLTEILSSKLLRHYCNVTQFEKEFPKLSLRNKWMYFNIARWEKVYNVELPD